MEWKRRIALMTMLMGALAGPALADSTPAPEPAETWECQQADGTVVYTNKEKPGCRELMLRPLSVVPSLDQMPLIPRSSGSMMPPAMAPAPSEHGAGGALQQVPDWARDWYASATGSRGEICAMYWEWVRLNEKTRGGFFYGTDPSYGGDPTGRNQRGASYSFYDNARYQALSRIFGAGFVPVGCQ